MKEINYTVATGYIANLEEIKELLEYWINYFIR